MNIIDQAAQICFDEIITDGEHARIVWDVVAHCHKLTLNRDSNSWIFGQYSRTNFCTPPDLLTYAKIFSWAIMGKMVMVEIPVGDEPLGDVEEELNNLRLRNLPNGIHAEFIGGHGGDNDGCFWWGVPLDMNMVVDGEIVVEKRIEPTKYERRAPLEVGYTKFNTTYFHLLNEGFLARWPYGSKSIYLISLDDDFRFSLLPEIVVNRGGE